MKRCLAWLTLAAVIMARPLLGAEIPVSQLNLQAMTTGWGTPQAGKDVAGGPMKIAGRVYTDGVGTHAPSLAVIDLGGRGERFTASVGVTDGMKEGGSVEFIVSGDDKVLFRSGVVRGGQPARPVDVPLAGVKRLKLEVTDGGDGMNSDHADWADAVITCSGAKPELIDPNAPFSPESLYPPKEKLTASPGNTTYNIDPVNGDDANPAGKPWKSFAKINAAALAPGDKVVIAPGVHNQTLKPSAAGTKEHPVVIQFLPGRHEFRTDEGIQLCYFVSNSADAPLKPRPIGILVKDSQHLQLVGGQDCDIWFAGRMTELINDHSEDITYSGLNFDLVRPTVSEFRVMETTPSSVVIQVAEGSTYAIDKGRFAWTGDLGPGWTMVQQADPRTKACGRIGAWDPFSSATAEDLGAGRVRLTYKAGTYGMVKGQQFQFRNVERDTTSGVNTRCKDIVFRDCNFYALTGMAIVSQFTENITFDHTNVVPRPGTIRTCPAWADCFHFSGCRGEILVDSCHFSGVQDDPINVHGTHLRIIEKTGPNQIRLRFMQPQTYGIAAFLPGDKVEFVNHATLRSYAANTVTGLQRVTDKDWLLTLAEPVAEFGKDDVVDNVSWYPNVTIRNCTVDTDSCRGFLITTRGKALVEGCTFIRTRMSAILCEDDAEGWFESGPLRDLTIRNNKFIHCGIEINPHTASSKPEEWVHENIRIENNFFDGAGVSARNVKGLTVAGNRSPGGSIPVNVASSCTEVKVQDNAEKARE
jgi:hypothetical protein